MLLSMFAYGSLTQKSQQVPNQEQTEELATSESKIQALEKEILLHSNLKLGEDLHVYDVPIDFEGTNYIHTYRCGDDNKETLVLVHGYGGCSVLYYPMLEVLAKTYRVFCIDLLGMGLSSRPEFKCTTTEETIDYFVNCIEKWRQAVNLESFSLAGHSFGGYMSTHYALRHQEKVKKLFLLSPAGITQHQTETAKPAGGFPIDLGWVKRKLLATFLGFWEKKTTPAEYFQKNPKFSKFMLSRYMSKQFAGNGGKVIVDLLFKFYCELFKLEGGSDKAVFYILTPPRAQAVIPVENLIMENMNIPVICFYGDRDWMDRTGAKRLHKSKKNFDLHQISNSGHQITMHNPKVLAECINSGASI